MRCDGSPDPTISGEINTYMNLWREDDKHDDIDNVLKESDLTLSVSCIFHAYKREEVRDDTLFMFLGYF